MAEIIRFPIRTAQAAAEWDDEQLPDLDVLTALDVAIRDLRDIADACTGRTRLLATDCMTMLERTFELELARRT